MQIADDWLVVAQIDPRRQSEAADKLESCVREPVDPAFGRFVGPRHRDVVAMEDAVIEVVVCERAQASFVRTVFRHRLDDDSRAARPDDARVPWHRLRSLPLAHAPRAAKLQALAAHSSQLRPRPDGELPVLGEQIVARAGRQAEHFFV